MTEVAGGGKLKEVLGCEGNPFECLAEALVSVSNPAAHGAKVFINSSGPNFTGSNPVPGARVAWDGETFDTDGLHDVSVNNSRLIIPSFSVIPRGIWMIHLHATLTIVTGGNLGVNVQKNGAAISLIQRTDLASLAATTGFLGNYTIDDMALVIPAAGDFFEVGVITSASAEILFDSQSRDTDCFFEAIYMGQVPA